MCPQESLSIDFNINGEYNPQSNSQCSIDCELCMKVCPFNDKNIDENEIGTAIFGRISSIKHLKEVGYYLDSYVGYSSEFRERSASGGITTWLLKFLLETSIVDYVVCVSPNDESEKLFKYSIFDNTDSVISSSGSVYYPVELSEVIKQILSKRGRYAIIGLPCYLKGLRLAALRNKNLNDRIAVLVGLTCGQMKNKYYTTYLSELANVGGRLQSAYYRGKSKGTPANNFYFHCINEHGEEGQVFWDEGVSEAFTNRWFTPNACNFCDDVFAELADITLMDAWLPEYINESKGTSLLIIRTPQIMNIIKEGKEKKEINIENIPIQKIIQSQQGVIDFKIKSLPYRLHLVEKKGTDYIPKKRYTTYQKISLFKKKEVIYRNQMQRESKRLSRDSFQESRVDLNIFKKGMYPYQLRIKILKVLAKCIYPLKIIRKIRSQKANE